MEEVSRLVRKNRERKIINEGFDTCECRPKNLKWVIPNRESLIDLLSLGIEKGE